MKRCTKCGEEKPLSEFHRRRKSASGFAEQCKLCHGTRTAGWYQQNKERRQQQSQARRIELREKNFALKEQLGCFVCDEHDPYCIDWHHTDPSVKEGVPADMIVRSWTAFEKEIQKCVPLCSNCHRKVHAGHLTLLIQGVGKSG